jgi:integrase
MTCSSATPTSITRNWSRVRRAGWRIHRALEIRVGQYLGKEPDIWRDPKLHGNDVFSETLVARVQGSAVLISVLSPRYVRSEWTRREVSEFINAAHGMPSARISEILAVRQHNLTFGATSLLHLKGKGRKERSVPLWPATSRTLRNWITECGDHGDRILFPNARDGPLSTDGATYILQQAVRRALPACSTLKASALTRSYPSLLG